MAATKRSGENASIYRIAPNHYLHVLDGITNVTRLETGPQTLVRQDNEQIVFGPAPMIQVPPRCYVEITNPVLRKDGEVVFDKSQQAKLCFGDKEIRTSQADPFPLYPGEVLSKDVTPLTVVPADSALRLRVERDFTDDDGSHVAGDELLFRGPGTYMPSVNMTVVEKVAATIVGFNQAIRVRARRDTTDYEGVKRVTGEVWLVEKVGAYLPGVDEEVLDLVDALVLTETTALHLRATRTFTDSSGIERKNGTEWLLQLKDCESHVLSVYEELLGISKITSLTNRQYCVVVDPCDENGKPQLGSRKLVKGPASFFLQPGESLEQGIQDVFVLGDDEGLVLRANEAFKDTDAAGKEVARTSGERWMVRGPCDYIPPIQVEVVSRRKAIPLDDNEGIYVRNLKSGRVRAVTGKTYLLEAEEELFEKELDPEVEALLAVDAVANRNEKAGSGRKGTAGKRDKSRVICYRVPHNAAVQLFDFQTKKSRVEFGPALVMLGPYENLTLLSLSGSKPKRPNQIRALCLLLGPDFATDIIVLETSDHARLQLQLSFNWSFRVDKSNPDEAARLFSVPDFVGDVSAAIASRIRGVVAGVTFSTFHKNSAEIIRTAVFGKDPETGDTREFLHFPANNLYITSVDIREVEPVDARTRDALQRSVQIAIETATQASEQAAKMSAERTEQEARALMAKQQIQNDVAAEGERKRLLELQAMSAAVESSGQAKAEAQSRAEAARIEAEAAVEQAELKAKALKIEAESELERLTKARESEIEYMKQQHVLEIERAKKLADLEIAKVKAVTEAMGSQTIASMATASADHQVKLLQGLGLANTTLISSGDGSGMDLFAAARQLIGALGSNPDKVGDKALKH